MRGISFEELLMEQSPSVDILVIDSSIQMERSTDVNHLMNKGHSTVVIVRLDKTRDNSTILSHDVFRYLEGVLQEREQCRPDITPFPKKQMTQTTSTLESAKSPDVNKNTLVIWSKILDNVYAHVWDELNQVYNVDFFKMVPGTQA